MSFQEKVLHLDADRLRQKCELVGGGDQDGRPLCNAGSLRRVTQTEELAEYEPSQQMTRWAFACFGLFLAAKP
jgi:hypothetical protein